VEVGGWAAKLRREHGGENFTASHFLPRMTCPQRALDTSAAH